MPVSLTGSRGLSMASIKTVSVVIGAAAGVGFYLYGPTVTPATHTAAAAACNEMTGGSLRSFPLEWVVDVRPHWNCWDLGDAQKPATDMGWWVAVR